MRATVRSAMLCVAVSACAPNAFGMSVEEYAAIEARSVNDYFKRSPPNDGATVSAKAYPVGKSIVYEYVLAIRSDVTEQELRVWRSGTRAEIVPSACAHLKSNPYFRKGFHFVYRYLNRSGRVIDEFPVNRPACEGL